MNASSIILSSRQIIVQEWIEKVKKEIPEAHKHDNPIVRNDVPHFLDTLVEALKSEDFRKLLAYPSEAHGKERAWETDYSLVQVLKEYRLLKEVIFNLLDEQGEKIEIRDRDGIMFAIDQAMEQAASVFYKERIREIEEARNKAEKLSQKLEEQGLFRDRFVASLTHDLRGPLNNTLQLLELLEERLPQDDEFVVNVLGKIKLSIERGNQLIRNLLDVNLIQSGDTFPLRRERSDLLPVIRKLLDNYQDTTRDKIHIENSRDEIIDCWDADALRRAIDNLVSNALKYGAQDQEITIRLHQDDRQTKISVHNFGNPIPPDKLQRLFDPYYRTRHVKGKHGWGLGLTLVQGVAQAHNGDVEVKSHPDDGTTFSMVIPRKPEDA